MWDCYVNVKFQTLLLLTLINVFLVVKIRLASTCIYHSKPITVKNGLSTHSFTIWKVGLCIRHIAKIMYTQAQLTTLWRIIEGQRRSQAMKK